MGNWARTLGLGFVMTLLAGGALAQAPGIRASLTYDSPGGQLVLDFDCDGQSPCAGRYLLTLNAPGSCGYQADTITITNLSLAAGAISGTALLRNVYSSGTTCQNRTFSDGTAAVTGTWNGSAGTLSLDFNGARFNGTFTGQSVQAPQTQNIRGRLAYDNPTGQHFTLDFDCEGRDPCVGRYLLALSGPVTCGYQTDTITITGLALGAPGPISGTALLKNVFRTGTTCADRTFSDGTAAVSGTWNGSSGTLSIDFNDARFHGTFTGQSVQTRVAASIGSTSTVHADILFRPQDIGTAGSVYVLAVAPVTAVRAALLKDSGAALPPLGYAKTKDGKDTSVACVLAQINQAGQLQAVSASSLQAYVSGVLGAQGQAIQIVNNVATVQIGGATFYVGYGASGQSMLGSGTNRGVVTIPGSLECRPQAPQTGWWFNPAEGGRGYSIEARGSRLFMAAFHYEPGGRATWNFAGGATSLDGSLFTADFLSASGGQTLAGPYRLPNLATAGSITFAFSDAQHGTLVWPGGTVAIERQASVPNGLTLPPQPGIPEGGWWWNPQESGRGFFIEWQGGFANIAGYMYDEQGRPTWYITVAPTPDPLRIAGNWWTFANGQAMGQPYRAATRTSDNAGALDVRFTSPTTATMRLPDGRTIPLVRQAF
jgi:hypothetical protein